ncbi:hypothetical protein TNCV_3759991 [Trichonephila clavipes]|nr:hypothetical protein TNCV_3759991 [Trichonephila clavipes]
MGDEPPVLLCVRHFVQDQGFILVFFSFCASAGKNRNACDGEVESLKINCLETTIDPPLQIRECCPAIRLKSNNTDPWVSRENYFNRSSPMS